jgi:hypothetical protein
MTKKIPKGKKRYVKIEALEATETEDIEWYAIEESRKAAKALADDMGMPADSRRYTDVYLTRKQYEEIPIWKG